MDIIKIIEIILIFLFYTSNYEQSFSQISRRSFKLREFISLFFIIVITILFRLPFYILILFFFYYSFKKQNKKSLHAVFFSLYTYVSTMAIYYFFEYTAFEFNVSSKSRLAIVILVLNILLTRFFHAYLIKRLDINFQLLELPDFNRLNQQLIIVLALLYFIIEIFDYYFIKNTRFTLQYSTTFSIFFLGGFLLCLFHIRYVQKRYLDLKEIEQKERENEAINQYAKKTALLYKNIRGIRHDLAGMVASLNFAINQNNMPMVKEIVDDVLVEANHQIQQEAYNFFELDNVDDVALKSSIFRFMNEAEQANIAIELEIQTRIEPINLPMLELVRMSCILLDNALEAAKDASSPSVKVGLIQLDDRLIYVVENTHANYDLKIGEIFKEGYSSKGSGRGIGLASLLSFVNDKENVTLDTDFTNTRFTQTLTIYKENL